MNREQYAIICGRRQAFDTKLWQTPSLAMAAQAFLLASAFNLDVTPLNALVLSGFSFIVGFASLQLIAKLRYLEIRDAELLLRFETAHSEEGYSILHSKEITIDGVKRGLLARFSSYRVWCLPDSWR